MHTVCVALALQSVREQQVSQLVTQSFNRSAGQLGRKPAPQCISRLGKNSATQLLGHLFTQPVRQPVTVSVFKATGSILINLWLAGQRAGPADEVLVSVLSASGGVTPSPQRTLALFEPDVGRQAFRAAPLSSPLLFSPLHSFSFAAAWPSAATHVGALMLLWMDRCCTSLSACLLPPNPSFSSRPSLFLPVGSLYPSIHLSPPFPLFSPHPPCLAHCPFPFRSGERVPCVCCLAACLLSSPPPLLLPHSLSFPLSHSLLSILALRSLLFLSSATFPSILLLLPPFVPLTLSTCL